MAEAFLKEASKGELLVESAGLEAGKLNPFAVKVMLELGIDISSNPTKSVHDFHQQGKSYDYVITVCDEGSAAACPVFPGKHEKIHWNFPDPSQFTGTDEERLAATRKVRDLIRQAIQEFYSSLTISKL